MTVPFYQLEGIICHYTGVPALGPVDLAIPNGERIALIGPSGSGKSTLLRLLLGLVRPVSGTVRFRGTKLDDLDLVALRRRIGYVIQEGGLFPHLTAFENVALLARSLGWDRARIAARVEVLASLVEISRDQLARLPDELSGGQRQRVGLMRALMPDPEALLLDEPLGALDPMIRFRLQEDLARIFDDLGKTVILVTHDLAEAAFLARRIVLLCDGRIVQDGRFADLLERPASPFVSDFVTAQRGHGARSGAA